MALNDWLLELAKILYTEYVLAVGGVAHDGKPLPTWEEFYGDPLKTKQAQGWIRVAEKANSHLTAKR